ncbi:MAG: methyltransferase domain-containing protein [Pseudomonadota bacterium]
MAQAPDSSEWATERGEKWRDHLDDLEAELTPINTPLIEALDLTAPLKIADLGCGGGGASRGIFDAAPTGSSVTGFDISPALIDAARPRHADAGANLSFTVADLQDSPPPAQPFDRLTSRFGVMFFPDPEKAFSNLANWLAPGGTFAFAVWANPKENPWMYMLKQTVAEFVDIPKLPPDTPGPFRYADVQPFETLLSGCGFSEVASTLWRGDVPLGGHLPAADAARFAISAFSIGSWLEDMDDEIRAKAFAILTERFAKYETDGAVLMPAAAHIVTGARN